MTTTENVIRWPAAGAVLGVAAVAAVASHEHAYEILMMAIRSSQMPADDTSKGGHYADPLQEQAAVSSAGGRARLYAGRSGDSLAAAA